jgi:hypothetical protein
MISQRARHFWFDLRSEREDDVSCPTDLSALCCLSRVLPAVRIDRGSESSPTVLDAIQFLYGRLGVQGLQRLIHRVCTCKTPHCYSYNVADDGYLYLDRYDANGLAAEHDAFGLLENLCCSEWALRIAREAVQDGKVSALRRLMSVACCSAAPPAVEVPPPPPPPPPPPNPELPPPVTNIPGPDLPGAECELPPVKEIV